MKFWAVLGSRGCREKRLKKQLPNSGGAKAPSAPPLKTALQLGGFFLCSPACPK